MAECIPFLSVADVAKTIEWYEQIGFKCTATNHIWEPGCELNWAQLQWENARFMIGPDERKDIPKAKDSCLWFNVDTLDDIMRMLQGKVEITGIEPETFYGRSNVTFKDLNGFDISFSCEVKSNQQGRR